MSKRTKHEQKRLERLAVKRATKKQRMHKPNGRAHASSANTGEYAHEPKSHTLDPSVLTQATLARYVDIYCMVSAIYTRENIRPELRPFKANKYTIDLGLELRLSSPHSGTSDDSIVRFGFEIDSGKVRVYHGTFTGEHCNKVHITYVHSKRLTPRRLVDLAYADVRM